MAAAASEARKLRKRKSRAAKVWREATGDVMMGGLEAEAVASFETLCLARTSAPSPLRRTDRKGGPPSLLSPSRTWLCSSVAFEGATRLSVDLFYGDGKHSSPLFVLPSEEADETDTLQTQCAYIDQVVDRSKLVDGSQFYLSAPHPAYMQDVLGVQTAYEDAVRAVGEEAYVDAADGELSRKARGRGKLCAAGRVWIRVRSPPAVGKRLALPPEVNAELVAAGASKAATLTPRASTLAKEAARKKTAGRKCYAAVADGAGKKAYFVPASRQKRTPCPFFMEGEGTCDRVAARRLAKDPMEVAERYAERKRGLRRRNRRRRDPPSPRPLPPAREPQPERQPFATRPLRPQNKRRQLPSAKVLHLSSQPREDGNENLPVATVLAPAAPAAPAAAPQTEQSEPLQPQLSGEAADAFVNSFLNL